MRRYLALFAIVAVLGLSAAASSADKDKMDKPEDSPAAAATRKLLDAKISVDYDKALLQDVVSDLKDKIKEAGKVKAVEIRIETKTGATNNMKVTYTGKDQTVADVLDGMGKKNDLGYFVISGKYKIFPSWKDGDLVITKGKERGYPDK